MFVTVSLSFEERLELYTKSLNTHGPCLKILEGLTITNTLTYYMSGLITGVESFKVQFYNPVYKERLGKLTP